MPKKLKALTPETSTEKQETLPATNYDNPWLEVAHEAGNDVGKMLKFVKGTWSCGDDEVAEGTEFVAHIDQLMRGWIKFEDGKVVERIIGKVADGFKPPPREELSDADPKDWREKDADGNPKDPWTKQWLLPLVSLETDDVVTFVTGSKGGDAAIADLCRVFGHKQRDGLLPIVALKTRSYKHRAYGRVETPEFAIVGWDGGMPKAEAAAPKQYPSDRIETHPARMAEEPPPYEAVPDGADDEIEL